MSEKCVIFKVCASEQDPDNVAEDITDFFDDTRRTIVRVLQSSAPVGVNQLMQTHITIFYTEEESEETGTETE